MLIISLVESLILSIPHHYMTFTGPALVWAPLNLAAKQGTPTGNALHYIGNTVDMGSLWSSRRLEIHK